MLSILSFFHFRKESVFFDIIHSSIQPVNQSVSFVEIRLLKEGRTKNETNRRKKRKGMASLQVHRCNFFEWQPSPIVALAVDPVSHQLAVCRGDDRIEIWLQESHSYHYLTSLYNSFGTVLRTAVWATQPHGYVENHSVIFF